MRLALAALVLVALTANSAEAQQQPAARPGGVYAFEGITYSQIQGPLQARLSQTLQLQVGLGYQPANSDWSYELMGRGGGSLDIDGRGGSLLGWGLRAKRYIPLRSHVHLYGRAGVTENLLTDSAGSDLVGFGLEYGAGAMVSFRVRALGFLFWPAFFLGVGPKVNVSLWADLGGEIGNLHAGHEPGAENYDYRNATASYGLSVGGHF